MMKRAFFILFLYSATCLPFPSSLSAQAGTDCHDQSVALRLSLDIPQGCISAHIINKQIDVPQDRIHPRTETPADISRRLKIISDWRQATKKSNPINESPK